MSKENEILNTKAREAVGQLLFSVISKAITPFEAVKYFPKNMDDTSLKIAWHALLHFDADEEMRLKDPDFAQEQFKYIELLASILSKGEALPQNMLDEYEALYITTTMPKRNDWQGILKSFFRFLN